MRPHAVYQIYAPTRSGLRLWKYGITRVGESRPRSQLKACKEYFGVNCTAKWLRQDVGGWEKARRLEAGYAARYKSKFGKCPPGMKRCL